MNDAQLLTKEPHSPGRLILPSLVLSYFATMTPTLLVGLLLLDMAESFGHSVSMMGQIRTASSLVAALSALAMGILNVRFNHKSLLMTGLLFAILSITGSAFASNFSMIFITYALFGIGLALIVPMIFTLVGEHFSLDQRARAIGWLLTGVTLAVSIGPPIIGAIAEIRSWRWAFLGYALPLFLLSLIMVMKGVPSFSIQNKHPSGSTKGYWDGIKEVISNHSAMACLMGRTFQSAAVMAVLLYGATFYRKHFGIPLGYTTLIFTVSAGLAALGAQISGRFLVNRIGRKPVTVIMAFFYGVFIISFLNMPHPWLAIMIQWFAGFSSGIAYTASSSLTMEQVPRFRGSMMSIDMAATEGGGALGAGVGGLALLLWGFGGVGLALGSMSIVASLLYLLLVSDPANTK